MKHACRQTKVIFKLLTILSFLPAAVSLSCHQKQKEQTPRLPDLIKTTQVTRHDLTRSVSGYGYVKAKTKRDIVASGDGIVRQLLVNSGDRVSKGDKLLRLKGEGIQPEIASARAELESARADLYRKQKEFNRIQALVSIDGSTKQQKEQVYAEYKIAQETLEAAKAQYTYYTEGVDFTAPLDGYVTSLNETVGKAVSKGELLLSVEDLSHLYVEVEIIGPEATQLKPGQTAYIFTDNIQLSAKVSHIAANVDTATGGKTVWLTVPPEEQGKLFPGDFCRAEIVVEKHLGALVVPKEALLNDQQQEKVIVKTDQEYVSRNVTSGFHDRKYVEILTGLSEGEDVVTTGAYELLHRQIRKHLTVGD